ncbi:MAG: exonuclease domain-containing protein [Candidatus Dadabacteria bacterium]|nr:exonuclease domain-containing protein [Candidatus Dadabacteria bacterium]
MYKVLDIETANASRDSICQIGIVCVEGGKIAGEWESLINPEDWFDPWNIDIHGIDDLMVENSPTFFEVYPTLKKHLSDSIVVSHTSFDRVALEQSFLRYGLEPCKTSYLDSAKMVRRAYPDRYGKRGYGLENVASDLGIQFNHHDALEDAKACAIIVKNVLKSTNTNINDWFSLSKKPIFPRQKRSIKRKGNEDGALYGEVVVFTGSASIPRHQLADIASTVGCDVVNSVSRNVTILVVGIQDERKLGGYEKSSKHRKAEELIKRGVDIQIMSEQDFLCLCNL